MLTQPRTWGWLFNPITVYLIWDEGDELDNHGTAPVGAVLEVTNTPWKERTHYPLALSNGTDGHRSSFDKQLHVSPFLDLDYLYDLAVWQEPATGHGRGREVIVALKVRRSAAEQPVVETELRVLLEPPSPSSLGAVLRRNPFPTHRVSFGIHWQAAKLARKRVPFVSHPRKQS